MLKSKKNISLQAFMYYDLNSLKNTIKEWKEFEYIFFWWHQPKKDWTIWASCFSQWFESSFIVDQIKYKTVEHWMMAEKARLFGDNITLKEILKSETPKEAKALGRKIKNFDENKWVEARFDIVMQWNLYKFSQNEKLKAFLLSTKDKIIVEASPIDKIWWIWMSFDNPDSKNPESWKWLNLLGFALCKVRGEMMKK